MMGLVPVRDGALPVGADETVAECDGRVLLAGSGTDKVPLEGLATSAVLVELGDFEPGRWAASLAPIVEALDDADIVILPNSPDGRDLAPRLALALDRRLLAGATEVSATRVRVARGGGLELHEHHLEGAFVATLQPGVRSGVAVTVAPETEIVEPAPQSRTKGLIDPKVVEVLPADVRTMDLSEAKQIVGAGAGIESEERFEQLDQLAAALGAVMGATRVITDRGWIHHDRQIGTTGVVVDPDLYISLGISGAVQHTSGLGNPDHIISVNTDAHCPMMAMSDLAIESDANATIEHLLQLLSAADSDTGSKLTPQDLGADG